MAKLIKSEVEVLVSTFVKQEQINLVLEKDELLLLQDIFMRIGGALDTRRTIATRIISAIGYPEKRANDICNNHDSLHFLKTPREA
jgi:hypothetical protein